MTVAFQFEQPCSSRWQEHSRSPPSRSTSPGSSSDSNPDEARVSMYQSHSSAPQLPQYDYPAPIFVRNTFLDTPIVRPLSLDEFIQDRRIQSCPIEKVDVLDDEVQKCGQAQRSSPNATLFTDAANDVAIVASRVVSSFSNWWNPISSTAPPATSSSQAPQLVADNMASQGASQVICLANAIQEPILGSSDLPSIGSAGHVWGSCKPCAFLYKRGCENGVQCNFCHICDSGEKKRRQKQKFAGLKEMHRLA